MDRAMNHPAVRSPSVMGDAARSRRQGFSFSPGHFAIRRAGTSQEYFALRSPFPLILKPEETVRFGQWGVARISESGCEEPDYRVGLRRKAGTQNPTHTQTREDRPILILPGAGTCLRLRRAGRAGKTA